MSFFVAGAVGKKVNRVPWPGSSKKNQERRLKQIEREREEGTLASRGTAGAGVGTLGALKATQEAIYGEGIYHTQDMRLKKQCLMMNDCLNNSIKVAQDIGLLRILIVTIQ